MYGRRNGGRGAFDPLGFWNLTSSYNIFSKQIVFLVARGENEISPFLVLPWKNIFGYLSKNHYSPQPWKNPSAAHGGVAYDAREAETDVRR